MVAWQVLRRNKGPQLRKVKGRAGLSRCLGSFSPDLARATHTKTLEETRRFSRHDHTVVKAEERGPQDHLDVSAGGVFDITDHVNGV